MFLAQYYSEQNNQVVISREQACKFAKQVADDFNPIHNVDAKRFCVPGDLLFAILLIKCGLSKSMNITFSGMVSADIGLNIPDSLGDASQILDNNGKEYLNVSCRGEITQNSELIESLIRSYVEFSGHTFPHILVDLMKQNNVMINPSRPMIMYERMAIELDDLSVKQVSLNLTESTLKSDGKRGNAQFRFDFISNGKVVGHGVKHMVLSGLRPYDETEMQQLIEHYHKLKTTYCANSY